MNSINLSLALRRLVLSGGAVILCGCNGHFLPSLRQPDRLYPIDAEVSMVRAYSEDLAVHGASKSKTQRNAFITARMYAIDLQYTKYESQLTHEGQNEGFLATAVNLGLTTTSTLVTPPGTKSILSGLATMFTGLDTAYNEKIF